jgi:hypothetical protein
MKQMYIFDMIGDFSEKKLKELKTDLKKKAITEKEFKKITKDYVGQKQQHLNLEKQDQMKILFADDDGGNQI